MMSTEDTDEDWEEQYVAVELIGMIDPDKLSLCNVDNAAILGISSEEMTVLKLGGYAFAGQYDDVLGSIVVFEECGDPESNNQKLKYLCHTTKVLKANRVFLKSKQSSASENTSNSSKEDFAKEDVEKQPSNEDRAS